MKKGLSKEENFYRLLILKIHAYTTGIGSSNDVCAAMISVVVWNSLCELGEEDALQWISSQVNAAMAQAKKSRKKRKLL